MPDKPTTAAQYRPKIVALVRATTLYIATKLGDLKDDVVIVGGLVPSLIVPQVNLPINKQPHIGTMDVDLGMSIAVLNEQRYHELCQRLKSAGFTPNVNEAGHLTSQRWSVDAAWRKVTLDFLIPPAQPQDRGGRLRNLEQDFSALITPGLELAFRDRQLVTLEGETIRGERASREVWVCGAGAFVILKALAFEGRGENKDAYDLIYLLQNYGNELAEVVEKLKPLLGNESAQLALSILERDFTHVDAVGPRRVAEFLGDPNNANLRADGAAAVRSLLSQCGHAQ